MLLQSGRVGEKGPQVTAGGPSLATSVQPSLSILRWPLPSQPRPEGLPRTEGFLKQIEKSWENHNSCPQQRAVTTSPTTTAWSGETEDRGSNGSIP